MSVTVSFEHWWWTGAACRSDGGFACSFVGVGFKLLRLLWSAALEEGVQGSSNALVEAKMRTVVLSSTGDSLAWTISME